MCDCALAELYAKAARERDEKNREITGVRNYAAGLVKKIDQQTESMQELRDALSLAEEEIKDLRARLEDSRPGGLVEWKKEEDGDGQ